MELVTPPLMESSIKNFYFIFWNTSLREPAIHRIIKYEIEDEQYLLVPMHYVPALP